MTEKVTERRVFSLGRDSFESLAFEATGEGETLDEARLCATRKILLCAYKEFSRIFGIRSNPNTPPDPNAQLLLEGKAVQAELDQLQQGTKST